LSGRGLCDELITRPEESYRLCCVVVCDLETSRMGAPYIYDISHLRVNSPSTTSQFATHFAAMFSENLKTGIQTSYSQKCVETLPRRTCRSMLSDITSEFGEATRHVLLTRESSTYFTLYPDYPFISVRRKHWLV